MKDLVRAYTLLSPKTPSDFSTYAIGLTIPSIDSISQGDGEGGYLALPTSSRFVAGTTYR